jgi:hypothetical protein
VTRAAATVAAVGRTVPYQPGGGPDRGVALAPDTAYGVLGHADQLAGGMDADRAADEGGGVALGEQPGDLVGRTDQGEPDGRVILGHEQCAVEHSRRSMVAAEEVYGDPYLTG